MTTGTYRGRWWDVRQWNRLSIALVTLGLGAIMAGAAFLLYSLLTGGSGYSGPGSAEPFGPSLKYFQKPTTAPTPTEPPSAAPIERLRIPKYGVDAPVIVLGVDANGAMETPEGPWEVAWYHFTGRPGFGSNAVFAGHVDANYTGSPGPAVFWHLKDLEPGDIVEVRLGDGTVYKYRVVKRWSVDAATADVAPIISKTKREVVTLITCGGEVGTTYSERLIVRAERIYEDAPASAAAKS